MSFKVIKAETAFLRVLEKKVNVVSLCFLTKISISSPGSLHVLGQQVRVEISKEKADLNDEVVFGCKIKDATSMVIMGKFVFSQNFAES